MNGIIKVYIRNADAGVWLALPTGKDDFQNALHEIKAAYSDAVTVGQYKTDIASIPVELLMSADLSHVNYLASRLAIMDGKQFDELEAIMQSPFRFTTLEQLIDYTYNEDYFLFRPSITDAAALGRYYVYDTGLCQMPDEWKGGIDLEKFGAHAAQQECGEFTPKGYLMPSGDEWHKRLSEKGIPNNYHLSQVK